MAESAPAAASPRIGWDGWRALLTGSPSRQVVVLTAAFVLLRLIASAFTGLGTDESYTVAVSSDLHLSYFDHPPLHYWMVHLVQPVLGRGRADRLPFIALFAGSSWLMFVLTRRLFGERAGVWAALAFNVSGFFTIAAGEWVLPDGPLILALLGAAAGLARGWFPAADEAPAEWKGWLAAGLWLGIAALSKYQAALFCAGLGIYMVTVRPRRAEFARPAPYAAAVVAAALLIPVLVWNARHGWASFAFQSGRGAPSRLHPLGSLEALAGQAILLLPWVFAPMAARAVAAARAGPKDERRWFCLMLGTPAIVLFTLTPTFGPMALPHWSMPGWTLLFPLLGEALARAASAGKVWPRRWAAGSAAFIVLVGAALVQEDATGWMGAAFPAVFPRGDPTAESIEWSALRPELVKRGLLGPGRLVVALKWNEAGKVDQALAGAAPVAAFTSDPREYAFRIDPSRWLGHDAVIVGRAETVAPRLAELRGYFRSLTPQPPIWLGRDGRREIEIAVVDARDLERPYPEPTAAKRPSR